MRELVHGNGYDIHIGTGLLNEAGRFLTAYSGRQACVISDSRVAPLYGEQLLTSLQAAGLKPTLLTVPEGEASKCPEMLLHLYGNMAELALNRRDLVIALGGGVIGDLAGFAAATYMRGIDFVQIPTSLLAQVDSSVGGKVAIDLPQGKNLAGTFYNPKLVLADTAVLSTLDPRQWAAGMAEVIKYGCIRDGALFQQLAQGKEAQDMTGLVARCIAIKQEYAAADPLDKGIRAQLNFGHTLGHAIESALGYQSILHGEGVALGMVAAARLGEALGITPAGTTQTIAQVLALYHLPITPPPCQREKVAAALRLDKKGAGRLVLLQEIGRAEVVEIDAIGLDILMAEVKQ